MLTFDIGNMYNGKKAPEYYAAYLAMFGGLNCLLEDFHGGESGCALKKFTENVFEPAFERVERELGFKPLIYKLPWKEGFDRYIDCPNLANNIIEEYKQEIGE